MARTNPETLFKNKVRKELGNIPGLWCVKIQQVALRGIPDLLLCYKGKFFAWELKTTVGIVSPLQQYTLDCISKAGGVARVVTPDNYKECLEEICSTN